MTTSNLMKYKKTPICSNDIQLLRILLDFSFKFEITAYTNNSIKLKLVESDFRFADYEKKYPLRTSVGTELTLERSIRE